MSQAINQKKRRPLDEMAAKPEFLRRAEIEYKRQFANCIRSQQAPPSDCRNWKISMIKNYEMVIIKQNKHLYCNSRMFFVMTANFQNFTTLIEKLKNFFLFQLHSGKFLSIKKFLI